jgi:hypothetical protein
MQLNTFIFNTLNAELNPICHFLTLLRAHHILHISRIKVKHLIKPCKESQIGAQFFKYIYCIYLHVSGNYVLIIRRNYRTHVTPGIYHSI